MDFTPSIAFAPIPQPSTYRLVRVSEPPLESVATIQRIVAEAFGVPAWTMTARDRQEHIARPRMIAMAITRDLTRLSLHDIGKAFGGRDHTTVLHAYNAVCDWATIEKGFPELIEQLKQRCRRGK